MVIASKGPSPRSLLRTLRPDVVITDIKMPNMNGIDLTREIKRLYPSIHVLAVTSVPDEATRAAMRDAGASGFIVKDDSERLNYALDVTSVIGPDRRRGDRARAIDSIWNASSVPSN